MDGSVLTNFSFWWIIPILMMILCFLTVRRGRDSMMCGFGSRGKDSHKISDSKSAIRILDERYALGEINKKEYEEKKECPKTGSRNRKRSEIDFWAHNYFMRTGYGLSGHDW